MPTLNPLAVMGLALSLLIGLPLLGVELAGQPAVQYLEFPPRTRWVSHAPFSWPVFVGMSLSIVAVLAPFLIRIGRCLLSKAPRERRPSPESLRPFPWWGWLGLAWTLVAWIVAWTRLPWIEPVQTLTFTPLWLGYILVVNAWTCRRGGTSVMLTRPAAFAALFPLSIAFWWLFEYLNRFVQNWHYGGITELSAAGYFLSASIPFSTVLPAVVSTYHFLATVPGLSCGLDRGPAWDIRQASGWAWGVLCVACAGLLGLGVWPNLLFPLVWVSPLLLIVSVQVLTGHTTILAPVRHGNWRTIWTAAMASLLCGLFWELWNWGSLAHWSYAIPYVDKFHLFAMPVLGYAGYLPFGVACVIMADVVLQHSRDRR